MPVLVNDSALAAQIRSDRAKSDGAQHDEVWEGVYIMSPLPGNEHQTIASLLWLVFHTLVEESHTGITFNGLNVSDREEVWLQNYREPDVGVFLAGNTAKDCGSHWCGGPDLVVEILSPNDLAREKRPFYAGIGVRELLIVDRDPWALELYRLEEGDLALAGRSTVEEPEPLTSVVLPLEFHLVSGPDRPRIEVRRTDGTQVWTI